MFSLLAVLLALFCTGADCAASYDEGRLYEDLFQNSSAPYYPTVRPATTSSSPITVLMSMSIDSFNGVDEVGQTISLGAKIVSGWTDPLLTWTPADYGGVTQLIVPPTSIWLPDFVLQNSADFYYFETHRRDFHVIIDSAGDVTWSFGGNFLTACSLDLTYYPFDTQSCSLTFENWAYGGDQVQLGKISDSVLIDDGASNGLWTLTSTSVRVDSETTTTTTFYSVVFTVNIQRKVQYYITNLVTPAILLVLLTLASYWLPADSGEKIGFGVTILLSFAVFLLVIQQSTPQDSDHTPLLSIFFIVVMVFSCLNVIISVLVLHFHHKNPSKRPPRWLRWICFRVGMRILCFTQTVPEVEESNGVVDISRSENGHFKDYPPSDRSTPKSGDERKRKLEPQSMELAEIRDILREFQTAKLDKEAEDALHEEYVLIGRVIDRLFFWITLISVFIASIAIFTSPP